MACLNRFLASRVTVALRTAATASGRVSRPVRPVAASLLHTATRAQSTPGQVSTGWTFVQELDATAAPCLHLETNVNTVVRSLLTDAAEMVMQPVVPQEGLSAASVTAFDYCSDTNALSISIDAFAEDAHKQVELLVPANTQVFATAVDGSNIAVEGLDAPVTVRTDSGSLAVASATKDMRFVAMA